MNLNYLLFLTIKQYDLWENKNKNIIIYLNNRHGVYCMLCIKHLSNWATRISGSAKGEVESEAASFQTAAENGERLWCPSFVLL